MSIWKKLLDWLAYKPDRFAVVEECERRILYSADLNPALWLGGGHETATSAIVGSVKPAARPAVAAAEMAQAQQSRQELVFVDANVANSQVLIDSILANQAPGTQFEIVMIETGRDGLSQISEILKYQRNIDALHIISHGTAGELELGDARIDVQTLRDRGTELLHWGDALTSNADLLLYGCDVGQGEVGAKFIEQLAQLTQTDVAASRDITGSDDQGGNWRLEVSQGQIESAAVLQLGTPWRGTLAANTAPTFNNGTGIVRTGVGASSNDSAFGVTTQADGKFLVSGTSKNGANSFFAVTRYNSNGSLDTSFGGGDGIVTTSVGAGENIGFSLKLQSDGKILVAGSASNGSNFDIALIRYNSDGTLDASFGGGDGIVTTAVGTSDDLGWGVTLQTDGKILVAGQSANASGAPDFALVRYNSDGLLDTSFGGGDGIVTTAVGASLDFGNSVTVQSDGKILVAGEGFNAVGVADFALVRYNSDGTLDASFGGGDGIVTTDIGAGGDSGLSVTLQTDGKILVAGTSNNGISDDFALVRYNSDGTLDTSFGGGSGIATTNLGAGNNTGFSVTLQANGKILVAGTSNNGISDDFALVRYNSDGTLDASFGGGDGITTTNLGVGKDSGTGSTLQSDGKILVAGTTNNGINDDFALVRYNIDGTLDTSFGGTVTLNGMPRFIEGGAAVVLDSDVDVRDAQLDALNGGAGNYNGAKLTLVRDGGANAQDSFGFIGGNGITRSGETLIKNGKVVATFNTTSTPGQLVVTFTIAAGQTPTSANVDAVLRQITYSNSSKAPPATVKLNWSLSDGNSGSQGTGGALSVASSTTVTITPMNDAPVVTTSAGSLTYAEGTGASIIDSGLTATDADSIALSGATVTITGNYARGQDVLGFTDQNGITGNWNADTGVLTLSGNVLQANYQTALRSVTYFNTSGNPSTGTRTIAFALDDGNNANNFSNTATRNINLSTLNDAPVNSPVTLPAINEDSGPQLITQADLLINATDRDSNLLTAQRPTLVTGKGSFVDNGDGTWTYTPALNDDSSARFSYTVTDGVNSVAGEASLDLLPMNDAPDSIGPASTVIDENTSEGTAVLTLQASDPDTGERLTFELLDDAAGRFSLDSGSNVVRITPGTKLDFEKQSTFDLQVRVTDSEGLTRVQSLQVALRKLPTIAPEPAPTPMPAPTLTPTTAPVAPPAATPAPSPVANPEPVVNPTATPQTPVSPTTGTPNRPGPTSVGASLVPLLDAAQPLELDRAIAPSFSGKSTSSADKDGSDGDQKDQASVSFEFSLINGLALAEYSDAIPLTESPTYTLNKLLKIPRASREDDVTKGNEVETQEPAGGIQTLISHPIHVASAMFTVGVLWYVTRSGGLITTILMGVPAWRQVDLLPVLLNQAAADAAAARKAAAAERDLWRDRRDTIIDSILGDNMVSRMFEHSDLGANTQNAPPARVILDTTVKTIQKPTQAIVKKPVKARAEPVKARSEPAKAAPSVERRRPKKIKA